MEPKAEKWTEDHRKCSLMICTPHESIIQLDQIQENRMGRACGAYGEEEYATIFFYSVDEYYQQNFNDCVY